MKVIARGVTEEERRVFYAFIEIDKILAWYEGLTFRGYTLKRDGESWVLIMRAEGAKGPLVSFTNGSSPYYCWLYFLKGLARKESPWRPDRYASSS